MIKISWNEILNTVNSTSGFIHVSNILEQIGSLHTSVHTAFLTTKHKKVHIKLSHNCVHDIQRHNARLNH